MTARAGEHPYKLGEEIANSVIHGAGALLAIAALTVLTTLASLRGNAWHVVGVVVFGTTLILLYSASTLYHSIKNPRAKSVFRILDHAAIFLLIAGTYTPFTLVSLRGPWGWSLLGVIWGLALAGVALKVTRPHKWRRVRVVVYVAMGWAVVVALKPLLAAVAPGGLALMLAGGVSYTAGIAFYSWHRLPYHHAVWHVFVLAGSVFHFFAILLYVIPAA